MGEGRESLRRQSRLILTRRGGLKSPLASRLILQLETQPDGTAAFGIDLALSLEPPCQIDIDRHAALLGQSTGLHANPNIVADIARDAHARPAASTDGDVEAVDTERTAQLLERVVAGPTGELRHGLRELQGLPSGQPARRPLEQDAGEDLVLRQVRFGAEREFRAGGRTRDT